jgi:Fur family ferric uptake transcriptional regulator
VSVDKDEFKELLRQKGLKVTNQRVKVLEALSNSPDIHLTAEEIYELIKVDFPEIGLATVYRTIQLLLELNLIDRINLDDGFVRYEISDLDDNLKKHHHHHLICVKCSKVLSFEDDLLDELEKRIMDHVSFKVLDHEVKLYGVCKECSANEKE